MAIKDKKANEEQVEKAEEKAVSSKKTIEEITEAILTDLSLKDLLGLEVMLSEKLGVNLDNSSFNMGTESKKEEEKEKKPNAKTIKIINLKTPAKKILIAGVLKKIKTDMILTVILSKLVPVGGKIDFEIGTFADKESEVIKNELEGLDAELEIIPAYI